MVQIAILRRKCDGCFTCAAYCPFGAIVACGEFPEITDGCKACGACVKACKKGAIVRMEGQKPAVDTKKWRDILVVIECVAGKIHPVSLELIGKAIELSKPVDFRVKALLMGYGVSDAAREIQYYGVDEVAVYDDIALSAFRADAFCACAEAYIEKIKPSVVLVGATSLGRSLAPRLATRFKTGLTADCTRLEMRDNTDLVQIRPAFGGNIMAQIVTQDTRPQFATVRYKVMDAPKRRAHPSGDVVFLKIPRAAANSPIRSIATRPIAQGKSISDAQVLVVAGRGFQKEADLSLARDLAHILGGDFAVTRPLVERGWADNSRQIGLSGRTVRPELIITCGVRGAIQFTACMNQSARIVAINKDPEAPIFNVAHMAIVGDIYKILPELIAMLKEEKKCGNLRA